MMSNVGAWIPVVLFGVVAVFIAVQIARRGLRGFIFGAPVERTIADIDLGRRGLASRRVLVHHLDLEGGPDVPDIALELDYKTVGGFSIRGIALTRGQATALADALYEGAGRTVAPRR